MLRSFARSALSFAQASVAIALREVGLVPERAQELGREAEFLRVDLLSAGLPYDNTAVLRHPPQGAAAPTSPVGNGEVVDLGEWLRALHGPG